MLSVEGLLLLVFVIVGVVGMDVYVVVLEDGLISLDFMKWVFVLIGLVVVVLLGYEM